MDQQTYTGINIQYPISQLIIKGIKTIETRTYPIPAKYLNQEMALIETPGKEGKFKARVIAIIKFTQCFQYSTKKEFYSDSGKHCVTKNSKWSWREGEKWGWPVKVIQILESPIVLKCQKGIVYTTNISLS